MSKKQKQNKRAKQPRITCQQCLLIRPKFTNANERVSNPVSSQSFLSDTPIVRTVIRQTLQSGVNSNRSKNRPSLSVISGVHVSIPSVKQDDHSLTCDPQVSSVCWSVKTPGTTQNHEMPTQLSVVCPSNRVSKLPSHLPPVSVNATGYRKQDATQTTRQSSDVICLPARSR